MRCCVPLLQTVALWLFEASALPVLVPAPRQMTLAGGDCAVLRDASGGIAVRETTDASLPPEGYRISVSTCGVYVASADMAGAFYARQTLAQLVSDGADTSLPCVEIEDWPAYSWRGVHFDDCRGRASPLRIRHRDGISVSD